MSKYGHIPHNDIEAFLNKIGGEEVMRGILRGEYTLTKIAKAVESLFEDMDPVMVDIDQSLILSEALKTCDAVDGVEALWVHPAFASLLTLVDNKSVVSVTMKPHLVKKNSNDSKMKGSLPSTFEHEPTAFVWMLATELTKVRSGKPSKVLAKGRWCLFYVAGLVVDVRWASGNRQWYVRVWEQGVGPRLAESVVFSCN